MANGNNKKKKQKKKKSNAMPALVTFFVLTVITGILVAIGYITDKKELKYYAGSNNQINTGIIQDEDEKKEEVSIKINLNDCSIKTGTAIKVTADVYPSGGDVVSWISSNENVFVVEQDGRLVVTGTGIGVLTASVGSANDNVIIEGVDSSYNPVLGLPDYEEAGVNETEAGIPEISDNILVENQTASPVTKQTSASAVTAEENTAAQPTAGSTENIPVQQTEAPAVSTQQYTEPSTTQKPASDIKSTDMSSYLTANGFEKHVDGTYLYTENGVYCGEILIDSDKTHIYIIEHSSTFDSALLSSISLLLPESYENVWKTALNASGDMTLNADGRTIRIVVPKNNGHKQIVIYN